jgi:hypothetical protein
MSVSITVLRLRYTSASRNIAYQSIKHTNPKMVVLISEPVLKDITIVS